MFRKPGFFRIFPNEGRSALQVWQVSILRWASRIAAKTAPFQVFYFFNRANNRQNYRFLHTITCLEGQYSAFLKIGSIPVYLILEPQSQFKIRNVEFPIHLILL